MPAAVRIDALRRATQAMGGVDALAAKLGVSVLQLQRWMNGDEAIATDIFLLAVDLIEGHSWPGNGGGRPAGNDTQPG
jgi:hypothetical protein